MAQRKPKDTNERMDSNNFHLRTDQYFKTRCSLIRTVFKGHKDDYRVLISVFPIVGAEYLSDYLESEKKNTWKP